MVSRCLPRKKIEITVIHLQSFMSILMCESGGHTDGEMNILGYCTCCAEQYGSRYDFIAVLSDM